MRGAALAVVVLLGAVLGAQQQVFRAGRTTVAVPVTVFDRHGNLQTRLQAGQFRIFDDGRPQEITNFSSGETPIAAVVLIDTSASMTAGNALAREAAEQFVIRMRPGDRAGVGTFNSHLAITERLTGDRDALLRSIREPMRFGNPTRLFDAIDHAVSLLGTESGRRIVLVLSDGCDTTSTIGFEPLVDRLRTEDVMVYAVHVFSPVRTARPVRGRRPIDCSVLEAQFVTDEVQKLFAKPGDPRRTLPPDQIVGRLTTETGGGRFPLRPTDNVGATFTLLMNELHHQYLLGFAPQQKDGRFHEIRVGVTIPDLFVRARRSYRAETPER